jgi:hypothetical protein
METVLFHAAEALVQVAYDLLGANYEGDGGSAERYGAELRAGG